MMAQTRRCPSGLESFVVAPFLNVRAVGDDVRSLWSPACRRI